MGMHFRQGCRRQGLLLTRKIGLQKSKILEMFKSSKKINDKYVSGCGGGEGISKNWSGVSVLLTDPHGPHRKGGHTAVKRRHI